MASLVDNNAASITQEGLCLHLFVQMLKRISTDGLQTFPLLLISDPSFKNTVLHSRGMRLKAGAAATLMRVRHIRSLEQIQTIENMISLPV